MGDVHNKATRSYNMSQIKGRDTKPEEIVRKYLFSHGFRYRKNDSRLPGKPDIVLPKYKTVIFVNGCFWHHHNCKYFKWPQNNADFWIRKITENEERDRKNIDELNRLNWNVIIIWECEIKNRSKDLLNELTILLHTEIMGSEAHRHGQIGTVSRNFRHTVTGERTAGKRT